MEALREFFSTYLAVDSVLLVAACLIIVVVNRKAFAFLFSRRRRRAAAKLLGPGVQLYIMSTGELGFNDGIHELVITGPVPQNADTGIVADYYDLAWRAEFTSDPINDATLKSQ